HMRGGPSILLRSSFFKSVGIGGNAGYFGDGFTFDLPVKRPPRHGSTLWEDSGSTAWGDEGACSARSWQGSLAHSRFPCVLEVNLSASDDVAVSLLVARLPFRIVEPTPPDMAHDRITGNLQALGNF